MENIIIIGSGPAGMSAGIYAARAGMKPIVLEGLESGGQLMQTQHVANYPGFPETVSGPTIIAAIRKAEIPARLSLSAGAYVCNDLYFAALKHGLPALFIHVPGSEGADATHAALAIQIAIETALHKA